MAPLLQLLHCLKIWTMYNLKQGECASFRHPGYSVVKGMSNGWTYAVTYPVTCTLVHLSDYADKILLAKPSDTEEVVEHSALAGYIRGMDAP